LYRLGALAQCDTSYFEQEVTRLESDYVSHDENGIVLDKRGLMGEHDALVSRLWKRVLSLYVKPEQLNQAVIDDLCSLVKGPKGKEFRFRQVQVLTSYDTIKVVLCSDIEKK
jgi:tRNA(Ile)-lysidine synthase